MATELIYKCDRCGQLSHLHLNIEVATGQQREVDLCLGCTSRAMLLLLEGMGYRAKAAWLTDAVRAGET